MPGRSASIGSMPSCCSRTWCGRPRTWLLAHDGAPLADADARALTGLLARRASGEPLAYLIGEREFHGLVLHVTPDVLVPRPDTETLVDWALELLSGPLAGTDAPCVVDLGTGSGAIALALKHCLPACAGAGDRRQRRCVGGCEAQWPSGCSCRSAGTWATGGMRCRRPRYAACTWPLQTRPMSRRAIPHLASLRHEPLSALVAQDDAGDGLAAIERVVADAPARLHAGGWLLIEHGFEQARAVSERMLRRGFSSVTTRQTWLAGHASAAAAGAMRQVSDASRQHRCYRHPQTRHSCAPATTHNGSRPA